MYGSIRVYRKLRCGGDAVSEEKARRSDTQTLHTKNTRQGA